MHLDGAPRNIGGTVEVHGARNLGDNAELVTLALEPREDGGHGFSRHLFAVGVVIEDHHDVRVIGLLNALLDPSEDIQEQSWDAGRQRLHSSRSNRSSRPRA